jgi:leucyl aminopeptidase
MSAIFATKDEVTASAKVTDIYVVRPSEWETLKEKLTPAQQKYAAARKFTGGAGQMRRLPNEEGEIGVVLYGAGPAEKDTLRAMRAGGLSGSLSAGYYRFAKLPSDWRAVQANVGWGIGAYKFDAYLSSETEFPTLIVEDAERLSETRSLVEATHLCRDLINTPAGDMGPVALHKAAESLAAEYGADVTVTIGEDLLEENLPMIHAVGRAAHEEPRLVEFEWGDPSHPRLALIGKGITFDTGGVNIKSAAGARIMKKDMGGAAHALALSKMIMANNLPIRLHCLVSIAENAVSAGAYRPGDILSSRAGLTVEIDNTDAEGRLVLGDALTKAAESEPVLMIDFATLTGAARVALGPTLPPFFSNREAPVADVLAQAKRQNDPIWHMPLWQPYNSMLSSPIADMKNAGGGFAGSVTAALFLERFVKGRPWMHLDVYGWCPTAYPGHPKGGDAFALRGLYHWLKAGGLNGNFSA